LARAVGASVKRFAQSRRGVAAIEFAFIAPVLLMLYFMTMEVSQAIETNKKVGRAASMIADLITQQPTTTKSELDAIMQIGEATLQPYNRSELSIYITGVQISNDPSAKATVAWTRQMINDQTGANPNMAVGAETPIPDDLRIAGTFLVRVQTKLNYRPVIVWSADAKQTLGLMAAFDNINMSEQYYLRPRMSDTVSCGDC
jgi:Flp pilus assembly protein TadG